MVASPTLLNTNNEENLDNFFDQFDDLQDDSAELNILDANINDIFPSIWIDETSPKLTTTTTDIDLALQSDLIKEAGMDIGNGKMCVPENGGMKSEKVHPVSELGKNGMYPDLKKIALTDVPVHGRARTKRPRQTNVCAGDASQQLTPVGWTWTNSDDEIRRTVGKRKRVANKNKVYTPAPMAENQNINRYAALMEVGIERKCTHCEITRTPQWRLGPLGPKTLCNACGVRYKSGRLFPEYRPAASPTFSPSKHSNSHRKIIEMRKNNGKSDPVTMMKKASEVAGNELVPVTVKQIGAGNHQLVPVSVEQIDGAFSWA